MAKHRDLAELIAFGLGEGRALDQADQLRLEQMLQEITWAAFHIWDRTQRGIFPKGTFEITGGKYVCAMLATEHGSEWWRKAKHYAFLPDFVADVDKQLNQGSTLPLIIGPSTSTVAAGT